MRLSSGRLVTAASQPARTVRVPPRSSLAVMTQRSRPLLVAPLTSHALLRRTTGPHGGCSADPQKAGVGVYDQSYSTGVPQRAPENVYPTFPPGGFFAPPPAGPPPVSRKPPALTIALVTLLTLAAMAAGVLGVFLYRAHETATAVAAREAAEDDRQSTLLADTRSELEAAKDRTAAAQDDVRALESRLAAAEAQIATLEAEVDAARNGATSASAQSKFLSVAMEYFPAGTPSDALIDSARATCTYFDGVGHSEMDLVDAMDIAVDSGYTVDQAAAIVAGAVYAYCPEHSAALV
jgi:Protein of unknown function (DUF732)